MKISEIYDMFDKIGCCTFATIDGDYPETRIAHFIAHDADGLYFMTMTTKPFYEQLKTTGKVSVCGLSADANVNKDMNGNLLFEAGYTIRISGEVKEISMDKIKEKNDQAFDYCIKDTKKYPAMVTFCLYNGHGEVFDYDFEKQFRDHKLQRSRFSFGGALAKKPNLILDSKLCIECGKCFFACSFNAIEKHNNSYSIDANRCDECGDCYLKCPTGAIKLRNNLELNKIKKLNTKEKNTMDLNSIKDAIVKNVYGITAETKKVPMHSHEKQDEIFYCIKGSGIGTVEDEEIELTVGKIMIVPAGKKHSLKSDTELYVSAFLVPVISE